MENITNPQELIAAVASFAPDYYVGVRNPKWIDAQHTRVECEVNFKHVGFEEWTPFCADPADFMPYSKQIFDECAAGKWGVVAEYVAPVDPSPEPVVAAGNQANVTGAQTL